MMKFELRTLKKKAGRLPAAPTSKTNCVFQDIILVYFCIIEIVVILRVAFLKGSTVSHGRCDSTRTCHGIR